MMNYLQINYQLNEISKMSTLALAYIGDAVYEICSRVHVFELGNYHSLDMHKSTVHLVNAKAQALACEKLISKFNDEEIEFYKRGRNAKVNSVPKGATQKEYHMATGLETVFGYLFMTGQSDRINELYSLIVDED